MGRNREQKIAGREKARRYRRPNVAFVQAQLTRQEKERKEKIKRGEKRA